MSADYYQILGVPRDATQEAIRRAYRRIALVCHPDRTSDDPEAEEVFKKASEAYAVLSETYRRKRYDRASEPPLSVCDLFLRRPEGRKVMEMMLPTAPAAATRGVDYLTTAMVSADILENGGVVDINILDQHSKMEMRIPLVVPPGAKKHPWCRISGLGGLGKNGGENGDLLVWLVAK